jgi:small subunit ribosomal protein S1
MPGNGRAEAQTLRLLEELMSQDTTHPDNLMSMEELLATYGQGLEALYTGQILSGHIMQVSRHEILIDVGAKSEGVIESKELDKMSEDEMKKLSPGDTIRVFVVRPESMDGHPILSIARAKMEQDWEEAERLKTEDEIFETRVLGANKGGLIVNIGQVRGFVPASQVSSLRRNSGESEEEYQRRLMTLTGKILKFKVLELDRRRNRLIMSERAADREWRRDQKEKLLDNLEPGAVVKGEVSSVADFGAFVDLGGADGLIHLSELSWGRIQHPSEVVKVGDKIQVQVLTIDRERRRIALSLKRLQPEPWTQFLDQHNVGDQVEATITKLTNFGAFARVNDTEIEGLIHISELAEGRVDRPGSVVAEGETVTVTIIRIDSDRKRLGLSLRPPEALQLTEETTESETPLETSPESSEPTAEAELVAETAEVAE